MNALEQLEADEHAAFVLWHDYELKGMELRDKWMLIKYELSREKMKAEIMAEELSKTETK